MNMMENNETNFDKTKSMKLIKIIIVVIVLLFLITIGIIGAIYYLQSKEFKFYLDGSKISNIPSDLFIMDEDNLYISIKDFAPYVKYTAKNGEYKQYSEDITSCYLESSDEIVTYSLNSSTIYKKIVSVKDSDYEYFKLEQPVKMVNDKLYTTIEGISIGCNVYVNYDKNENTLEIYTLPYLTKLYGSKIKKSTIAGENETFSNKKAVLYGLVVVKDDSGNYGVYDTNGSTIIGEKYTDIKFVESAQEFIVRTEENKIGIIGLDGTTKIKPEYNEIKQIDKKEGLYLIRNSSNKYGIVNKSGSTVIFPEYDEIGVDGTKFANDNIENNYILYDNCIPVKKADKWGLMDKKGNKITEAIYDGFGCIIGTATNKSANNLLLIPEYEGIVVYKDKVYGLINSSGTELIPIAVTDIYSVTSSGNKIYYLTYEKNTINVLDYLQDELKIPPVNKNAEAINNTNTTISTNTVQEENNTSENTVTTKSILDLIGQ